MPMNLHYLKTPTASLEELGTDPKCGLTEAEAFARLAAAGPNELMETDHSVWGALGGQFSGWMFLLPAGGSLGAMLAGEWAAALAFLGAALFCLLPDVVIAGRGRPSFHALKKLIPAKAHVLRESEWKDIPVRRLVRGDILQLEAGEVLPADIRFIEVVNLRVQEAVLTGDSGPVEKQVEALTGNDLPLPERRNLSYMGALVTQGRGLALVIETGMGTELGRIATAIQRKKKPAVPGKTGTAGNRWLGALIGLALILWLAWLGLGKGIGTDKVSGMGLSAIAALAPTALPAVRLLALALGSRRMRLHGVRVHNLAAVEKLGLVDVICADKAGTLTENRMIVTAVDVADHVLDMTGEMDRGGSFTAARHLGAPAQSALSLILIGGALCNDARLIDLDDNRFHTLGDPTEGALVAAAARMGYWKASLDRSFPRVSGLPFDPERKRMTTVHALSEYDPTMLSGLDIGTYRYIAITKGNVGSLLALSSQVLVNGSPAEMSEDLNARIEASGARLAQKGMRVLGVAFRLLDQIPELLQTDLEQNLTFLGLFGMTDPARPDVPAAVRGLRKAGIRTVMLTTDQPMAAAEIGRQLGLIESQATGPALRKVLMDAEVESLEEDELERVAKEVQVYVRLSPESKARVLDALRRRGHAVALTGGEVTDGPVLRQADVGAAMGLAGTEAAREAADLVLLDDNFASLAGAVGVGRSTAVNLYAFFGLLIAGIAARGVAMLAALVMGGRMPLDALQWLWLSLIVDSLLGIGLVLSRGGEDAMQKPVNKIPGGAWAGITAGIIAAGITSWYVFTGRSGWQGPLFSFLGLARIAVAWGLAAQPRRRGWLPVISILAILLLLVAFYLPALRLEPVSLKELLVSGAGAGLVFLAVRIFAGPGGEQIKP